MSGNILKFPIRLGHVVRGERGGIVRTGPAVERQSGRILALPEPDLSVTKRGKCNAYCRYCGRKLLKRKRSTKRFCNSLCRVRKHRWLARSKTSASESEAAS